MSAIEEWAASITVEALDHDPYPIYARMRAEAPVCFVPAVGLWFVTRWADVEFAASHPELIDSAVTPSPLDRALGGKSILVLDGPPQRKLRAMLDPSLRPRVVEASAPDLVTPIVESLLDDLAPRGEAELMSEYFEPVSVLSLGRILGLGETDGDTLRRWFHGLAQGAINFENDPAKWVVSDATAAEIDAELEPVLERLWASPDSSTISTMLQHAEGTFEERVATILPTLKVILLGGMQEPGPCCGIDGGRDCSASGPGRCSGRRSVRARPGRGRGRASLGFPDRHPDPSCRGRPRARRGQAPGRRQPRSARLVGQQ